MKIGIAIRKNDIDYFVHKTYINLIKNYNYGFITLNSNLDEYDGFLISGGYDIDSKYYSEIPIYCNNIDEEIDLLYKKIIEYSIKTKKPLL